MRRSSRRAPWGVVLSSATRVVAKAVCYSERNAYNKGRAWKASHPGYVVRVVSLLPGDTSPPETL